MTISHWDHGSVLLIIIIYCFNTFVGLLQLQMDQNIQFFTAVPRIIFSPYFLNFLSFFQLLYISWF